MLSVVAILGFSAAAVEGGAIIVLPSREIKASDLAIISGGSDAVIGHVPLDADQVEIDQVAARRLVVNRLPGARFTLRYRSAVTIKVEQQKANADRQCFFARHELRQGEIIMHEDVYLAECGDDLTTASLGYDRERKVPFARSPIPAGASLGSFRPAAQAVLPRGQRLVFKVADGPVVVQRRVESLQAGRPGQAMFARTEDGDVIAARLSPDAVPQEDVE